MMIKRFLLSIALGMAVLGLTGCEMSKSTPPPEKKNPPKSSITSTAIIEVADQEQVLRAYASQTALATTLAGIEQTPASDGTVTTAEETQPAAPGTLEAAPLETPVLDLTNQPALVGTPDPNAMPTVVALANIPTATAGPIPQTYTLQEGEFPFCLARRYNVSVASLLSLNGLGANSMVSPGQTLKIPQGGAAYDGPRARMAHPTTYMVKAGDTVYSIACMFGDVDPFYLAQVNNIAAPYTLSAGQTLQVP